jgi:hypothetical protein
VEEWDGVRRSIEVGESRGGQGVEEWRCGRRGRNLGVGGMEIGQEEWSSREESGGMEKYGGLEE